jgi:DNA-binding MarR family transcriptional regulator
MSETVIKLRRIRLELTVDPWNVNKADIKSSQGSEGKMADTSGRPGNETLLFLTDEQLRKGIEAMFFAYRGFTADPDRILTEKGYGRAHHRAIHFINRTPGTTVNNLLSILGVTKQSLNRVLRTLIDDALVSSEIGTRDKRERHLYLTESGLELERELSDAQRERMRAAFRQTGPEAVAGFRQVLEAMMDGDMRRHYAKLKEDEA